MATATGKAARRRGGNRHDIRKANRNAKHKKVYTNNALTPEAYRKMKLSDRKALARKGA